MHGMLTYNYKRKLYTPYFSFQAVYCLVGFGDDSVQILMDQFECFVSNPDLYFELVYLNYLNCKCIYKYIHTASVNIKFLFLY